MQIAIDDTDSRNGMCTTYALSEIIRRSGMDVIGFPALVRLNPAIPHKTRGNGALVVSLGRGRGASRSIGRFGSKQLLSFSDGTFDVTTWELMNLAEEVLQDFAVVSEPDTNPGIVVSESPFPADFYWKAVREEIAISEAESFIRKHGGKFRKIKSGRGIIGAAAAISWPAKRITYELLTYRYPFGESLGVEQKMRIAEMCDSIPGTFNNIDRVNRYPAVFPKQRTPVIMGIRGTDPSEILGSYPEIARGLGEDVERYLLFQTNQGTDDHIISDPAVLKDGRSYEVSGEIAEKPSPIRGSHYFSSLVFANGRSCIAAFEPTKGFRDTFRSLLPGDRVRIYGTYKDGCVNVEKLEILSLSTEYIRESPECPSCGKRMSNRGYGDYRCTRCGERKNLPAYRIVKRSVCPGRYDVPVMARRHISRPFELDDTRTTAVIGGEQ